MLFRSAPVYFVKFATDHAKSGRITSHEARQVKKVMLEHGYNPDIPLGAYFATYVDRFHWDLSPEERRELAVGLEKGDHATITRHQTKSQANSAKRAQDFNAFVRAILPPLPPVTPGSGTPG